MASIKELKKQIRREKAREAFEKFEREKAEEKRKLKEELFTLRHRKAIRFAGGVRRVTSKIATGAGKVTSAIERAQRQPARKKRRKSRRGLVREDFGFDLLDNI